MYDYELPLLTTEQLAESVKEHIKESARREQELFGQMSKWSNLYSEVQNQLYDEDKLVKDSIKDFAPVGDAFRWQDGSLNDFGKKETLLCIKGLVPAIDEFVQLMDFGHLEVETYDDAEIFQKLEKNASLNIFYIGDDDLSFQTYREMFPNAIVDTFEQTTNKIYDLFISCGKNSFAADLNILNFALQHTKKYGIILIKNLSNLSLWKITCKMLVDKGYKIKLLNSDKEFILLICT
jgi:hypothetical protein